MIRAPSDKNSNDMKNSLISTKFNSKEKGIASISDISVLKNYIKTHEKSSINLFVSLHKKTNALIKKKTYREITPFSQSTMDDIQSTIVLDSRSTKVDFSSLFALYNEEMLSDRIISLFLRTRAAHNFSRGLNYYYVSSFFYSSLTISTFGEMYSWMSHNAIQRYLTLFSDVISPASAASMKTPFDFDLVFLPIHRGLHWTLALFSFKTAEAFYFDSLGGDGAFILKEIADFFVKLAGQLKVDIEKNIKFYNINCDRQTNGVDCGVAVCMNALLCEEERFWKTESPSFGVFRRWLFVYLLHENRGRLSVDFGEIETALELRQAEVKNMRAKGTTEGEAMEAKEFYGRRKGDSVSGEAEEAPNVQLDRKKSLMEFVEAAPMFSLLDGIESQQLEILGRLGGRKGDRAVEEGSFTAKGGQDCKDAKKEPDYIAFNNKPENCSKKKKDGISRKESPGRVKSHSKEDSGSNPHTNDQDTEACVDHKLLEEGQSSETAGIKKPAKRKNIKEEADEPKTPSSQSLNISNSFKISKTPQNILYSSSLLYPTPSTIIPGPIADAFSEPSSSNPLPILWGGGSPILNVNSIYDSFNIPSNLFEAKEAEKEKRPEVLVFPKKKDDFEEKKENEMEDAEKNTTKKISKVKKRKKDRSRAEEIGFFSEEKEVGKKEKKVKTEKDASNERKKDLIRKKVQIINNSYLKKG